MRTAQDCYLLLHVSVIVDIAVQVKALLTQCLLSCVIDERSAQYSYNTSGYDYYWGSVNYCKSNQNVKIPEKIAVNYNVVGLKMVENRKSGCDWMMYKGRSRNKLQNGIILL